MKSHHPISELVSIPVVEAAKFPSLLSLTAKRKNRKGKLNQSETFLEVKKIPANTEEWLPFCDEDEISVKLISPPA